MKTPEELRELFWKEDYENGGIIKSQYEEIQRVLKQQDKNWVDEQYKNIKEHAIQNVPFYAGMHISEEFPIMNKTRLLNQYNSHRAMKNFEGPIHISSTSGSTGTPFSVEQDYRKRQRTIADLQVFGELCNYFPRERMVFFRTFSKKLHRTPEQEERENIYYIDVSCLDKEHLENMYKAIREKEPKIVFSYASTLVELSKYIVSEGLVPESFSMSTILTAGETISDVDRKMLQDLFGCPVYRRYSDMELGILGQDKGDGGEYRLNWGSFYFEIIKLKSDEPAEDGEVGRIVITDLFNYAFPMIRYDTGDLGIMHKSNDDSFSTLIDIYGRSRDCVYNTSGAMIAPSKIRVMMWGESTIKQWQFIQKTKKEYEILINSEKRINEEDIIKRFSDLLGDDAIVTIKYVKEIPVLSSQKRRAIICECSKLIDMK